MRASRKSCAFLLVVLSLISSVLVTVTSARADTVRMGGYVDQIVFQSQSDPYQAFVQLEAGQMDLYTDQLRTLTLLQTVQSNPALRMTTDAGMVDNLFVNPVPINQDLALGQFNPFSVPEVRRALNYVLDRNYLSQGLIGAGYLPQVTPWTSHEPEYARDPIFFSELDRQYAYNFALGEEMIAAGLQSAGAYQESGRWYWQGNPIVVNFIVRIEDVRHQIGSYVRDALDALGFQVNMVLSTSSTAARIVYAGPPDDGAWQLYTEGWSNMPFDPWSDWTLDFFYAGGEGSPLWYTAGGPYRPSDELIEATTRLNLGLYADAAERQQLIETGTTLGVQDSVRVWLVAGALQVASTRVTDFAYDLAEGTYSPFTTRTARFGEAPGGTLRVGTRLLFVGPWSPWVNYPYLYDTVVLQTFTDEGIMRNPYTSEPMPARSAFEVTTAGPASPQAVPEDAIRYDVSTNEWVPVESGTTAVSKVEFTYTFGTWHDGVPMSMDDVQYAISLLFRRTTGDVSAYDPDAASPPEWAFAQSFRGLRIVDADTLDVYTDLWHFDPAMIANRASVFPKTPWEIGELAMATVFAGETRISEMTAIAEGLVALDLVRGASLGFLDGHLPAMVAANERPPGASYISEADASARWSALSQWRATYGHFYVSNGPYYLAHVDPVASTATLQNFDAYVFPADHWDALLQPRVLNLDLGELSEVIAGAPATFAVSTSLAGFPYDDLRVFYAIVRADTGELALKGQAANTAPGQWAIALEPSATASLASGHYLLRAIAAGNEATIVVSSSGAFDVLPGDDVYPPVTELASPGGYWIGAEEIPFQLTATGSDVGSGIANIELFYTYQEADGSWTPATSLGRTTEPFVWSIDPASMHGDGLYRFVSVGIDGNGNTEDLDAKLIMAYLELRVDTEAPTVVGVLPADGAAKVSALDTPIRITFSEPMDPVATAGAFRITPAVQGSLSWDGPTLVFTPATPLARGTTYAVRITTAATDLAGNPLALDFVSSFETAHRRSKAL